MEYISIRGGADPIDAPALRIGEKKMDISLPRINKERKEGSL